MWLYEPACGYVDGNSIVKSKLKFSYACILLLFKKERERERQQHTKREKEKETVLATPVIFADQMRILLSDGKALIP